LSTQLFMLSAQPQHKSKVSFRKTLAIDLKWWLYLESVALKFWQLF